ncbi:hypothetical protein OAF61_02735 [Pseudomonadales bacterium]|jgi:hypothetical protein|nr:hypothetical protein [Pseudomonadales bacterium]
MPHTRITKSIVALITAGCLTACISPTPKYTMNKQTSAHPATERFTAFANAAKTAKSHDELLERFYTAQTQRQISGLIGWRKLLYSSSYRALKRGTCESIELKVLGPQVQIDCFGTMIVPSMFLGDQQHRMHLRVYLVQEQSQWYLAQAGYVSVVPGELSNGFTRAGLRFKSAIE